jgi:hypothetical protein
MYGITQEDIEYIDSKIQRQIDWLKNFNLDFGDKMINMLENSYSANLNPKKYFAEINNRVNSMFDYARDHGLKPVFVTLTVPSKYHRPDVSHNETAKILTKTWNKFTNLQIFQKMKKELNHGLVYFRVYEPHKSGVPHMHAMLFLPSSYILPVKKKFKEYFSSDRLGTNRKAMDFRYTWYQEKGGAAAYIMKYICKTFKDENSEKIEHAVYWYIKHRIRRFLSSRTLAPLTVYRKVRHYFKDKFQNDFKRVSNMWKNGIIKRFFDGDVITYMYFDPDTGEVEEQIVYMKNPKFSEKSTYTPPPIKLKKYQDKRDKRTFVYENNQKKYVYSEKDEKFIPVQIVPSRLDDYELFSYWKKINDDIDSANLHHYGVVKNEMIKRQLIPGEILSLNDYNTSF